MSTPPPGRRCIAGASRVPISHTHTHRLGPDEPVLKSGCLLTKQPSECTLTAVGPLKVLVLHRAREQLAAIRYLLALRASGALSGRAEESAGRAAPLDPAAAPDPAPMGPEERCGPSAQRTERTQLRQRRVISRVPA